MTTSSKNLASKIWTMKKLRQSRPLPVLVNLTSCVCLLSTDTCSLLTIASKRLHVRASAVKDPAPHGTLSQCSRL